MQNGGGIDIFFKIGYNLLIERMEDSMTIDDVIEKANVEYKNNGRSKLFVRLEDAVINKKNVRGMYYFARYVKGSSVDKIQNAIIDSFNPEILYYFTQNVKGADFNKSMEAVYELEDSFWINKFKAIRDGRYESEEFQNFCDLFDYDISSLKGETTAKLMYSRVNALDINKVIARANEIYEKHGNKISTEFTDLQKLILHTDSSGDFKLFLKFVKGAEIERFEQVALLRGDPEELYYLATQVKGINVNKMLNALERCRYDYKVIDSQVSEIESRKNTLVNRLMKTKTPDKKSVIKKELDLLENMPQHIVLIDNYFIPEIQYLLKNKTR